MNFFAQIVTFDTTITDIYSEITLTQEYNKNLSMVHLKQELP